MAGSGFPPLSNIPTAASRRSLGRVSVPVWLIILSDQLPIVALVGRYPTNKLIGRGPIPERPKPFPRRAYAVLAAVSSGYPHSGASSHALLTRAPVSTGPKPRFTYDLHVLSLPPAFVLSQDQTLRLTSPNSEPGGSKRGRKLPNTNAHSANTIKMRVRVGDLNWHLDDASIRTPPPAHPFLLVHNVKQRGTKAAGHDPRPCPKTGHIGLGVPRARRLAAKRGRDYIDRNQLLQRHRGVAFAARSHEDADDPGSAGAVGGRLYRT